MYQTTGFPSSLLALSDILEGRHSTSLQQYGTETRKKTGHTPNKVPGGLFTGSCGDETPSSSLATKPRPSPLLVSSTSHAIQKPVLKTSSTGTSEMGTRNSSPVAIQEFPKILGILKKEDKIIANFAAGKSQEPSTSNFDLLTSVFRGTESVETENIKTQQQQQQQHEQQTKQKGTEGEHSSSGATAVVGSGGEAAHSHSTESGTGLRLAQYTLDSVPEAQVTQSRYSSRLLELMSSAKNTLLTKPLPSETQGFTTIDLPVNPKETDASSGELVRYPARLYLTPCLSLVS